MRRARIAVPLVLLALSAACGPQADNAGGTAVAAGGWVEPAVEPATSIPTTTVPRTTVPAPATTAAPPTTARRPGPPLPPTTATTTPRPTTTSTTVHAPGATVTAHNAVVTLKASLRDDVPAFRVSVDVTTTDYVRSARIEFGDGEVFDVPPWDGATCSRAPRVVSLWTNHRYVKPGDYRIRAVVTIVPCDLVITNGPPDLPPALPSFTGEHVVETGVTVRQA